MATAPKPNQIFVILCGGTGPRLWPLSTTSHPKQFLPILSPDSLLEQTISRLLHITDKKNIFITTSNRNIELIVQTADKLLSKNQVIIEPDKKNTALAIYYTLSRFSGFDANTVVTFIPADHFINPINKYKNDLLKVAQITRDKPSIVTIGIHPTFPNTSFGYILKDHHFVEKPNRIQALRHIVNGALWNSGIYTATIKTYLSEYSQHFPNPNYKKSPALPFDKAISEKTRNIDYIKASFDWSDVGEWGNIFSRSKQNKQHIAILNSNTKYLSQDSHHCLVSSDNPNKLIGLVDVNNLAIIETSTALLVTSLEHSSQVRDLVTQIVNDPKLIQYFVDDQK